jgi:hypothetical protein
MAKEELKGRKKTGIDIKLTEHSNLIESKDKTENAHGSSK